MSMTVPAIQTQEITGMILAGGRGTRMQGADKGLQLLDGIPLVQHAIKRLMPQVGMLAINANRNLEHYRRFDLPLWLDPATDFAGPLSGLQAGLAHCGTRYLAAVPCDSPFFPGSLVQQLAQAIAAQDTDAAIASTGNVGQPQLHPVFCLISQTLLPQLTRFLQHGGRRMDQWFSTIQTAVVRFDDEQAFRNINTLQELQQCSTNLPPGRSDGG
jgi:molybdenum cofactor guanylyltransferase